MAGTGPAMTTGVVCARSAKAPLRDWQDTVARQAPVQGALRLPQYGGCRSKPLKSPDRPTLAHPARLILTLSLAPVVGLGIGRFAYSLVLPDMRETLHWSYSAAGFMNTINAAGYLIGALMASRLIRRFGFAHLRAIVFDHMIPRIALYYTRQEAIALLEACGLKDIEAVWVNENSWSVHGVKPTAP